MPSVDMPSVDLPSVDMPDIDMPGMGSSDRASLRSEKDRLNI